MLLEKYHAGLHMVEREIIDKVKVFVKEVKRHRINVKKVILYGSRVSGTVHEYSDIDVAIISPDFGKNSYNEGAKLFEIASLIDPRIEPGAISVRSFENDTWIPLIYEIRENGMELKAA